MFFLVGGAVSGALAVVWLVVRPPYQDSVIQERTTVIQQFLDYVRGSADERLARDVAVVTSVVREIVTRPSDADNILRTTMGLDPMLLEIRVAAEGSDQDLVARQSGIPDLDLASLGPPDWRTSSASSPNNNRTPFASPPELRQFRTVLHTV